jgi:hypothetical protein
MKIPGMQPLKMFGLVLFTAAAMGVFHPAYSYAGVQFDSPGDHRWICPWSDDFGQENHITKPITIDQAKAVVEKYLINTDNRTLKEGKISDKGMYFEVEILKAGGSLYDKVMVDKQTGWIDLCLIDLDHKS